MIIPVSIIVVFIRLLALIFSAFIFWRKLKEDYRGEEIFPLNILLVVAGFFGARVFSLQGAFLAIILSLIFFSRQKKWNSWQAADSVVSPLLLMILVFYLTDFSTIFLWRNFSVAILALMMLFLTKIMEKKYRSISWYKSGKVGFLACFSIMAFFGLFLVLELFYQEALYLTTIVDLGIVIIAFVLLYRRSERDWLKDKLGFIKFFKNYGR